MDKDKINVQQTSTKRDKVWAPLLPVLHFLLLVILHEHFFPAQNQIKSVQEFLQPVGMN